MLQREFRTIFGLDSDLICQYTFGINLAFILHILDNTTVVYMYISCILTIDVGLALSEDLMGSFVP